MRTATYRPLFYLIIIPLGLLCINAPESSEALQFMDESTPMLHYQGEELAHILSDRGYTSLAKMLLSIEFFIRWKGPLTLFVPTNEAFRDSNIITSEVQYSLADLQLRQHIVKGDFSSKVLAMLPSGTKLETIADGHSLVITASNYTSHDVLNGNSLTHHARGLQVYVNEVPICDPDVFNDGLLAIHGVEAFLESMSSPRPLSLPLNLYATLKPNAHLSHRGAADAPAAPLIMPFTPKNTMLSLRERGYSILGLAMDSINKCEELLGMGNVTVFAVDDESIVSASVGAQGFMKNVRYHIVPNNRLLLADLLSLPVGTRMATLDLQGESLVVTGTEPAVTINGIPLKSPDAFFNQWIALHGIPLPLPRYHFQAAWEPSEQYNTLVL